LRFVFQDAKQSGKEQHEFYDKTNHHNYRRKWIRRTLTTVYQKQDNGWHSKKDQPPSPNQQIVPLRDENSF